MTDFGVTWKKTMGRSSSKSGSKNNSQPYVASASGQNSNGNLHRGTGLDGSSFSMKRGTPFSNRSRQVKQTASAVCVVGALAALSLWAVFEEPKERTAKKKETPAAAIAIHPEYVQRETYIRKSEARIDEIGQDVSALATEVKNLRKELQSTTTQLAEAMRRQKDTLATLEEVQAKQKAVDDAASGDSNGDTQSDLSVAGGMPPMASPDFGELDEAMLDGAPTNQGSARAGMGSPQLTVVTLGTPKDRRRAAQVQDSGKETLKPSYAPTTWLAPDSPIAVNRAPGSTIATYLPPGAFARATLLTGVYASTGGTASDPMPVLMKVENAAMLPNKWQTNIERCMLTGSATGDLSSERVHIRLDRLSCVGDRGETLDVRISGYAVGADGKVGVRGRLVTRSGQAIAAAISTSMLQGIGRAVSLTSQQTTTSLSTGTQTVDYANAWRGGLGDGFAKGMDRISAYFLRLAEKILPVLEIDAGSPVDIVVSQGVLLSDR